jgi:hypothetical protein
MSERWSTDDPLIISWRVSEVGHVHPLAVIVDCDGCGEKIYAGPASIEAQRERGFHLICRECAQVLRTAGHELKFGGRYHPDGPIPWDKK